MIGSRSWRAILAVFSALLVVAVLVPSVFADPSVFPASSSPYGRSYGEWSARWWQWAVSFEPPVNPLLDGTGAYCASGQSGPVWFLAGNFGGSTTRTCTIPANTALLYPIINSLCWRPGDSDTEAGLRTCAAQLVNAATNLQTEVDGASVQGVQRFRTQSPLFQFTVPGPKNHNILGISPPLTRDGVADGYWIMLAPLSAGNHVVHFHGEIPDGLGPGVPFVVDVTYRLTVG